ncbi:MAG TPA: 2'-5' RNA ligase family protein [Caulobacteraceae bacterium]|jgi:2'-5' RNA ligase|nr:2'-5' RNA ligase family protein [Caulobacteraceae bacterium]
MSELFLFDEPPRARRRNRSAGDGFAPRDMVLFLVHLDEPAAASANRLAREVIGENGFRGGPHSNLHFTLHPIDDFAAVQPWLFDILFQVGDAVNHRRFEVMCDQLMRWSSEPRGPLVMIPGQGGSELKAVFRQIRAGLDFLAPRLFPKWSFSPHVTLAHTPMLDRRTIAPIGWTVGEFCLVRSIQAEARHIVLRRWPLRE